MRIRKRWRGRATSRRLKALACLVRFRLRVETWVIEMAGSGASSDKVSMKGRLHPRRSGHFFQRVALTKQLVQQYKGEIIKQVANSSGHEATFE